MKRNKYEIIIDTREKTPLFLSYPNIIRQSLAIGDYSIKGYESLIAIERKGYNDYISCCKNYKHFYNQIKKLSTIEYPFVVFSFDYFKLIQEDYLNLTIKKKLSFLRILEKHHIPYIFIGDSFILEYFIIEYFEFFFRDRKNVI